MTKVAVVTGASAGVGRATVEEFARQGYDVALLAREPDRLNRVAAELENRYSIRALAIPTDVADADAIEKAATRTEEELGPIDVWVFVRIVMPAPKTNQSTQWNLDDRLSPEGSFRPRSA